MNLVGIASQAAGEMQNKRLQNLYQRDFLAWQADVLGLRTYEKMQQICNTALFDPNPRTVIKSSNGTSKDLALDTPILTTEGWKTMESVRVGDKVFSEEGTPIPVVWKSEVFHKPSFKVLFDDGSYLVTSDSHEWNTISLKERGNHKTSDWRDNWDMSSTKTTGEIRDTLLNKTGKIRNHLVPLARPVQFPEADLPVHPYVLGAWLGDGTSVRAEITCNYQVDGYVVDRICELGYPLVKRDTADYSYVAVRDQKARVRGWTSRLKLDLTDLGVVGNKHIPEEYLYSSVEQRIELVRGLMDTDGSADQRGALAGWGQSNIDLVGQFCDLLTSLGVRFSITEYQPSKGKKAWTVKFRSWFDPFTPGERKSKIYTTRSVAQASRLTGRTIISVTEVPSVSTQCIQVDSDRHLYLAGSGLVPTHNSFSVSAMIAWTGAVFDVGEAISIVSAPSLTQIEKVTFKYLKSFKARAKERGFILPGHINEQLEWQTKGSEGSITIAYGKKPAPGQEVNVFQGIRSEYGRTYVWFDEAGGMSKGMWTAAEAVLTGADARFTGIGNPDDVGTEWHRVFTEKKYDDEYNRFSISSFELPTFTGEIVYPEDPEMQERMMRSLTQVSWVEHKKRIWGEKDARYLSKVLGEFPEDGGNGFFPQASLNRASDTNIPEDLDAPLVLGVDIARWGQDESVIASNRAGRIRVEDTWGKCDLVDSARKIHSFANLHNAAEVRIDSTGVGGGVFDMLDRLDEFEDKCYTLIGWDNGTSSPDITQWSNLRAYSYDSLRTQMMSQQIDLDIEEDRELKEELQLITYKFTGRGGIQITPKDDLKTEMGGSPDRLDAVVMAGCDMSPWTGNPLNALSKGDRVVLEPPTEVMGDFYADMLAF